MKLQKIVKRLQKLHPKEIDLSLDRVKNLCQKLNNPQDQINCISIVGTKKWSNEINKTKRENRKEETTGRNGRKSERTKGRKAGRNNERKKEERKQGRKKAREEERKKGGKEVRTK